MEAQEALREFTEGTKEAYRERQLNTEEQWPPVSGEKLVNLQLVQAEKQKGFRAGLPQHGSDDKVKRTPILYGDLFKVEEGKKSVKKIIFEGNAGIGKSTLCTVLAEGWAEGNILTQFDCVLLLPLRDQLVSSAFSLPDLLALHHPDEIICEFVVRHLKRTRGKGVLIIADGWDELSEANRSKESFLYNLLFGRLLPSASVVLTSRPSASAPLHDLPSVDRLVEVVGFNEESIKQYIEQEFEQFPEKASSLIEQLENNPIIRSVCSVPLNCAIVCNLWHALDQKLPRTLTGLYTKIVLNIILRNIKKKLRDCPIGLKSFDEIPNVLQDTFWLMCEFAYECLLLDQLVFSEAELSSRLPEVGDKLQCFGLLQSAHSLLPVGHGLSFHFAHLTIQEFLAALHLTTLPKKEKLKVVQAHVDSGRFDMVWRFMFGLASNHRDSRSDKVVSLDDGLMERFLMAKKRDVLSLCHLAFEASDPSLAVRVSNMSIRDLFHRDLKIPNTPFDCVARFYVVRHVENCDNMVIKISYCAIDDKLLKELTDILSNANGKLQVRQLCLVHTKLSDKGLADLFKRASIAFTALDDLSLSKNIFTNVMSSFMHASCMSLTLLDLSHNPLGVSGILSLETAVQSRALVNLEILFLSKTLTDDADINGALLTTLLQSIAYHCAGLKGLHLSDNILGLPGLCSVVENIPIELNYISLSTTHLAASFHPELHYIVTSEMLNLFPNSLCRLKKMYLGSSNFSGTAGTFLLAKFLQVFQSLEDLDCFDCSLTSADIIMLIHHLKSANVICKNLRTLGLIFNNIDDEGVMALSECLPELFPSLDNFNFSEQDGVVFHGNPVSEESLHKCNEHLKTYEELQKTAVLNDWERTYLPPQNEKKTRVFYKLWDMLMSKMIRTAEVISPADDSVKNCRTYDSVNPSNDITNDEISIPVPAQNSPQTRESPSDELTCPTVKSTQVIGQKGTDSVASVAYSSKYERVAPPLSTTPPKATQTNSEIKAKSPLTQLVPPELTHGVLNKELKTLTKPIQFGHSFNIPVLSHRMDIIQQDNRNDTEGQKIALFQFIAKNYKSQGITWSKIADALHDIDHGDLASAIRGKYCTSI